MRTKNAFFISTQIYDVSIHETLQFVAGKHHAANITSQRAFHCCLDEHYGKLC